MSAEQNHEHNDDPPQLSSAQIGHIIANLEAMGYFDDEFTGIVRNENGQS